MPAKLPPGSRRCPGCGRVAVPAHRYGFCAGCTRVHRAQKAATAALLKRDRGAGVPRACAAVVGCGD